MYLYNYIYYIYYIINTLQRKAAPMCFKFLAVRIFACFLIPVQVTALGVLCCFALLFV